ncbi:MAG: hypothetical protein KU37_03545 [Sulfuricurvum sp. PC08-66]|nr:MAG: hypothetical protein KU37_03545 [Sulfuricurvum sp. PC08-66]
MKKLLLLVGLLFFFAGCAAQADRVTGKIVVRGEYPHTFIALKVQNRLYYNIVGRLKRVLEASYQGKKVTLRGRFTAAAKGPGMPARFEATHVEEILER